MKKDIIQEQHLRDLRISHIEDESIIDTAVSKKGVEDSVNTFSLSTSDEVALISCFKNIKNPKVLDEIDIYDFLECVRRPEQETKNLIDKAREFKANRQVELYYKIKGKLPCFTLNFSFDNRKNNKTIKAPTGFIYIDVDNQLDVDLSNNLVFASWKSLSALGRGVLVKVEGLTLDNFKTTYLSIARSINIYADKHAAKATQYTIHSYDEDIYINYDSTTWYVKEEVKNTPTTSIYKKEKKDTSVPGEKYEIRYNKIADLDFNGKDYLFFPDEKLAIPEAYIPSVIRVGARNQILSAFAYQIRALNPDQPEEGFKQYIMRVNRSRCTEPLKENEVIRIVSKILKLEFLEPIYNSPRRIIFSPKSTLTNGEKSKMTNKYLGMLRSNKTKFKIKECLDNWNTLELGKVTQKKLALESGKNIKTIQKYYKEFVKERERINNSILKK